MGGNLITKKKQNRRRIVSSILIVLFFFFFFIRKVSTNQDTIQTMALIMAFAGLLSCFYYIFQGIRTKKTPLLVLFMCMLVFSLISSLHTGIYQVTDYILFPMYFGVALLMLNNELDYKVFKFNFCVYIVYFVYFMISDIDPNNILNSSRNTITFFTIVSCVLFYLSAEQCNKRISILPALIVTIISFWAVGRSGIIASCFLLFAVYWITNNSVGMKKKLPKASILIVLCIITYFILRNNITDYVIYGGIERITEAGFASTAREIIRLEYYSEIRKSALNFFLGVPPTGSKYLYSEIYYNPHNSYISLHAYYGLAGFLLVVASIINSILILFKRKKKLYVVLLITILIRISTDTFAFYGPMDPVIYYFILFTLTKKNKTFYRERSENGLMFR